MQIDKDQKATAAIIVTLLAGFGFGVYLPNQLEIGQLEEGIAQSEGQIAIHDKNARGLNDLRVAVADMRVRLKTASKHIPESNELASFLRTVDSELDNQKMIDAEKLTERIVPGQDYNVIPLSLRFKGDYNGLFRFVSKLENEERLIRINRLEVKGQPHKPDEPVDVRVELSTFASPVEANRS